MVLAITICVIGTIGIAVSMLIGLFGDLFGWGSKDEFEKSWIGAMAIIMTIVMVVQLVTLPWGAVLGCKVACCDGSQANQVLFVLN